jgi:hypothetical protein
MSNNPLDDRNYYNMLDDDELIELTKSVATNELALVLAERLKKERNRNWQSD